MVKDISLNFLFIFKKWVNIDKTKNMLQLLFFEQRLCKDYALNC